MSRRPACRHSSRWSHAPRAPGAVVLAVLVGLLVLLFPAGWGPGSVFAAGTGVPTRESVEKWLKDLEGGGTASETHQALKETLTQTLTALQAMTDAHARFRALTDQVRAAPAEIARLKALVAAGVSGVTPLIGSGTPLTVLEQTLDRAEADGKGLADQLAAELAEAERLQARRKDLPARLAAARQRGEALTEKIAALVPAEAGDDAGLGLLQAQNGQAQEETRLYQLELDQFGTTLELSRLRRELLTIRKEAAEIQAQTFRRLVDDRRRREAAAAVVQAQETARDLGIDTPVLANLAQENAAWAAERHEVALRMEGSSREVASLTHLLARLRDDHRSLRDKIQAIGFSDAIGLLLRVKRAELPSSGSFQEGQARRAEEISLTQLRLIEIEEALAQDRDLDARARDLVAGAAGSAGALTGSQRSALEAKVKTLLRQRREILENAQRDLSARLTRLVDLDTLSRQASQKSREFAAFIDERVFWVRSCQPLGVADLGRAIRGVSWLVSPSRWAEVAWALGRAFRRRPLLMIALLAFWTAILASRLRLNARLAEIGALVQRAATDRFRLTLEAIVLTVCWAAPWPLLMWIFSLGISLYPGPGGFSETVAVQLAALALPLWGLETFRQVFRPDGLAAHHCHWHVTEVHPLLQRQARLLGAVVLPLLFLFQVVEQQAPDLVQVSLGRGLLVAMLLAGAWLLDPVTRPAGPVMQAVGQVSRERFIYRLRYLLFFLAVVLPVVMIPACLMGYVYTANRLWGKAVQSLVLILGCNLAYAVFWRALHVHRRSLALHKSQAMKAVVQVPSPTEGEEGRSEVAPAATGAGPGGAAHAEPSIFQISAQTEKLLFAVLAVAMLIGVFQIWAEVFPALRILDQVKLWTTDAQILEAVTGPDGGVRREWVQRTVDITLFDLLVAIGLIALTISATNNLPGFIEFAVLQRLDLEAGVKFAVRTLSSYVIGLIGFVVVMETVGLGWDKIQWLAAGVSVGLGFGLQEIFANFISGLILLFERPLRVGDIVTVGDTTGAVTRIQIRATTLMNADRKEVVIPNKELITGRLMNWTLSDPILRIVFPVGVAYGSDLEKVRHHLMLVARTHPKVLTDPAPQVVLTGFGNSSLNIEVRVYISGMDGFPDFQHEMNQRICRVLGENGIQIPFPQQDVTITNWDRRPDGPGTPGAGAGKPATG
ncbi:MAG: mechanosensitive ion channel [Candidatus Riflebacteria bacterium]|nr:mechanosensitive ion channel [Candidatus Riflebacteria bacterium]